MLPIVHDPYLSADTIRMYGAEPVDFNDLLERADFITLHVPLTAETANLLNADTLARVKPGCRIINSAAGGLVDEAALAEAVRSGHVAGAAIDVFAKEPPDRRQSAARPRAGDLHPAPAHRHRRRPGQRHRPGRPADRRFPAARGDCQRGQRAVDQRRTARHPAPLHCARRVPRLLPGPALCPRTEGGAHRVCRRGDRHPDRTADHRRPQGAAHPDGRPRGQLHQRSVPGQ